MDVNDIVMRTGTAESSFAASATFVAPIYWSVGRHCTVTVFKILIILTRHL